MNPDDLLFRDFLPEAELAALRRWVEEHREEFAISTVIDPLSGRAAPYPEQRRSLVLDHLGDVQAGFQERVVDMLPDVLGELGYREFTIERMETQATASIDGSYFRRHTDNAHLRSRKITYVYFFHQQPQRFSGGELRLFAGRMEGERYLGPRRFRLIRPRCNSILFFDSSAPHEVLPVRVPSRDFLHSRFTVNGWLHG